MLETRLGTGVLISFQLQFKFPSFIIYQAICDVLEETGRVVEESLEKTSVKDEKARWALGAWLCPFNVQTSFELSI